MEGMSLSQPEPRTSWDDDEDAEHEHGKRRGGLQSCKLRCAGVGTRKW